MARWLDHAVRDWAVVGGRRWCRHKSEGPRVRWRSEGERDPVVFFCCHKKRRVGARGCACACLFSLGKVLLIACDGTIVLIYQTIATEFSGRPLTVRTSRIITRRKTCSRGLIVTLGNRPPCTKTSVWEAIAYSKCDKGSIENLARACLIITTVVIQNTKGSSQRNFHWSALTPPHTIVADSEMQADIERPLFDRITNLAIEVARRDDRSPCRVAYDRLRPKWS